MKNADATGLNALNKIEEQLELERKKLDELVLQSMRDGGYISDNPAIMAQSHRVDDLLDAYNAARALLEQNQ